MVFFETIWFPCTACRNEHLHPDHLLTERCLLTGVIIQPPAWGYISFLAGVVGVRLDAFNPLAGLQPATVHTSLPDVLDQLVNPV